jgi:transglutaminase-like putative cysteine protease
MQLDVGCELYFEASEPTPVILMLQPRSGSGQSLLNEAYILEPNLSVRDYTDIYGNACQRLVVPIGSFRVQARTRVETSDRIDVQMDAPFVSVEYLPEHAIHFLLPSRYCQSDLLGDLALEIVSGQPPGYSQVEAIRQWIQTHVQYRYGTSNTSTSALDTIEQRNGVCRDFAHLGIALCRALNIPARMVVGYLYQMKPMDLHAWFEAFVGSRWYTFDATQPQPRGNRIAIAYGRDAVDVALATQFGAMTLEEMKVWVNPAIQQ